MKVGIVTFHDADNYGAVLQSYGLQTALTAVGAESAFLQFPRAKKEETLLSSQSVLMKRMLQHLKIRQENFAQFREKYLNIVPFGPESVEEYDCYIAGSDQVWNPTITGGNPCYLLNFAPKQKRLSYAASFGAADIPRRYDETFARSLSEFSALSVREESGVDLIGSLCGRSAQVDIDPSLLLTREDWEKLLAEKEEEKPYLLLITVQSDMRFLTAAREMAKARGLECKAVSASFFPPLGFDAWSGITVQKWLRLVHDAEVVLTSSFHGLAFSVLFEKEFYTAPLAGELADRNARVEEFFARMGIAPRPCGGEASVLDYQIIGERLAEMRGRSLAHLKEMVFGEGR